MKKYSLIIISLLCSVISLIGQSTIQLKWGVENEKYFNETNELIKKTLGWSNVPNNINGKTLRYILPNANHTDLLMKMFERHDKVWSNFLNSLSEDEIPSREEFVKFAEDIDPYYIGVIEQLAPVLYFDFIGNSQEYILVSIEVETIWYGVLKGGGFLRDVAWYDIVLKPFVGKYNFDVKEKLKFNGSGSAELRFWSDNFSKQMGMSPIGTYIINIQFNFLSNGEEISVQTNPFIIDV